MAEHYPVLRSVTGEGYVQLECACGWAGEDAPDPNVEYGQEFMVHALSPVAAGDFFEDTDGEGELDLGATLMNPSRP